MTPALRAAERSGSQTSKRVLLILLLLLASAEFIVRGPLRYFRSGYLWSDITQVYVPSRAWIKGADPYSPENFIVLYREATDAVLGRSGFRSRSPHPLTTLVVFSPIASLPWSLAHALWAFLTGAIIIPTILSLGSLMRAGANSSRNYWFAALTLALAPLQTGISVGNVSVPAIALCGIALWATARQKDNLAGALIAAGACLKPQIGILFVLYYLLRRRWRVALVAVALAAAVLLLGIARLQFAGTPWWRDFLENARFAEHNRLMDFADPDPIRFTMLNLQVLLYALIPSSLVANASALLVALGLWGIWAYAGLRCVNVRSELLMASTFLVIGVLPIYHRNYDATLLMLPMCWALSPDAEYYGRTRTLALLAMLPFLLPGPMLLQALADRRILPQSIVSGWWWNRILMPHQTWLLLILALILLRAMAAGPTSPLPGALCGNFDVRSFPQSSR